MEKMEEEYSHNLIGIIKRSIGRWILAGYQDRQWFLDFKDELNVLSIDEDRKDTAV